ncbi:MAG: glycosyltransferase family 1 protein [Chloroflexota bacterium]|nr:glycosyltransferase family 1 protein [Chloroflexota bacterium]
MRHIALNAHLLSRQHGYRTAGIHGYIDGLLRHLPAAFAPDWTLTAFVGGLNPAHYDGMTMRRASLFGRPLDTESPARRIVWEQAIQPFALNGFDLQHALAFAAPLISRPPCVVTIYDLSFIHYPERLPASRRLYLRWLTALTCRRARLVFAISASTARDIVATLGISAAKVEVIAPGTDRTVYRPLPPDEIAAFKRAKHLPDRFWLFVGTLEPRKNLPLLLEAYAALPAASRLPLILGGGKGWDTAPIFAAVERHGLQASVMFPGFIPPDDLPFWYNSAETFVYPSVFEGFGLPVLEAMACGTPVVVSDASSLSEVARGAGLLVPPHDVDAWTAALRRAADDFDWRTDARERGFAAADRYSWDVAAARTVAGYQKVLRVDEKQD